MFFFSNFPFLPHKWNSLSPKPKPNEPLLPTSSLAIPCKSCPKPFSIHMLTSSTQQELLAKMSLSMIAMRGLWERESDKGGLRFGHTCSPLQVRSDLTRCLIPSFFSLNLFQGLHFTKYTTIAFLDVVEVHVSVLFWIGVFFVYVFASRMDKWEDHVME